jgi:aspartyl/glutamyl-tRNA(Asn/Gln) amidotransferase C subunit
MIINGKLIEKIAKLAKLYVKDSEKNKLSYQLSEILEHMKVMDEVDVSGVEPAFHACLEYEELRSDSVESFKGDSLLGNVFEKRDDYISVPNIIVEEE